MAAGTALSGWWARELQRVHDKLNSMALAQKGIVTSLSGISSSQDRLEMLIQDLQTSGALIHAMTPQQSKMAASESSANFLNDLGTDRGSASVAIHTPVTPTISPLQLFGSRSSRPAGIVTGQLTPFSSDHDEESPARSTTRRISDEGPLEVCRSDRTIKGAPSPKAKWSDVSQGATRDSISGTETDSGILVPRQFGLGNPSGSDLHISASAVSRHTLGASNYRRLRRTISRLDLAERSAWQPQCKLPLDPDSATAIAADGLSLVMLTYDLLVIPLTFAWGLHSEGWLAISERVTVVFWTLLMGVGFIKGYHRDDNKVMDLKEAAFEYLRTWFIIDLTIVLADWIILALEDLRGRQQSGGMSVVVQLLPILRVNRVVRLVAVMKKGRVRDFLERLNGRLSMLNMWLSFRLALNLLLLISVGIMLNHWFACLYFALGEGLDAKTGSSWQRVHTVDGGFLFEYLVSMQWASAHMFGGSPIAYASNTAEFAFTIVADMILGGIFGSTLVSTVATVMMRSSMLKLDQEREMQDVRLFLWRSEVPRQLFERIMKELSPARTGGSRKVVLDDLPLLLSLPRRLRTELQVELFSKWLTKHSFFSILEVTEAHAISELCTLALEQMCLSGSEEIFNPGEHAVSAYILRLGRLRYAQMSSGMEQTELKAGSGGQDNWLAELALWAQWTHRGCADAMGLCELLTVKADQLEVVVIKYSAMRLLVNDFCRTICNCIMTIGIDKATDLPLRLEPLGLERYTIILQMPVETRMSISNTLFEVHIAQQPTFRPLRFFKKSTDYLRDEIEEGKCILALDDTGKLIRVVEVACLRITYNDKVLLTMGRIDFTEVRTQVICELPATRLRRGESAEAAAFRLVEEELEGLRHCLRFDPQDHEQILEESVSRSFGLPTKYVTRVFTAELALMDEAVVRVLEARKKSKAGSGTSLGETFDPDHHVSALDLSGDMFLKPMVIHSWQDPSQVACLREHKAVVDAWLRELSPVFHFDTLSATISNSQPQWTLHSGGSRAFEGWRSGPRRLPTIGSLQPSPSGSLCSSGILESTMTTHKFKATSKESITGSAIL